VLVLVDGGLADQREITWLSVGEVQHDRFVCVFS
jgi:hypothetical protein